MSNAGDDTLRIRESINQEKLTSQQQQPNGGNKFVVDALDSEDKPIEAPVEAGTEAPASGKLLADDDLDSGFTDTPFMPKMANETLKAQLGNSAWRLFHTILARYPDKPSEKEKSTLSQYIQLFAQVYPCGDCARHFQKLLQQYPPQVSSRKVAAVWGCAIHNKVNDRLKKPQYDCTTILEDYDCGCGDDEKAEDSTLGDDTIDHLRNIKVDEKEPELQKGG
jgi:FAD-linked sulfhydryl oxidase